MLLLNVKKILGKQQNTCDIRKCIGRNRLKRLYRDAFRYYLLRISTVCDPAPTSSGRSHMVR